MNGITLSNKVLTMLRQQKKIVLFQQTFQGRTDVIPRYWKSRDGKKQGYSPICSNRWKVGVCKKPCRTCPNGSYVPLSATLILEHFIGRHILGCYPLLKDSTLNFITCDLDNHGGDRDPHADLCHLVDVCTLQEAPLHALRSKSGKGYHAYFFFASPVLAWKARAVFFALLRQARVIGDEVEITSFDKLIPDQDTLDEMMFGNLVALPFQGQATKQGHTLFLNPETGFERPCSDQWAYLQSITKWNEAGLDRLISEWSLERSGNIRTHSGKRGNAPGWVTRALSGVAAGGRNDTGIKLAGYFRRKALPDGVSLAILNLWNEHNRPPLEAHEIEKIVNSASRYQEYEDPQNENDRIGVSFGESQGSS
jgi:hypothetical protein